MVARGCACGRTVGRCRARGARMQPSTIATSLKSTGAEDARNAFFGPFGSEGRFLFFLLWENRGWGSSSRTSNSQCTVLSSKKSFILKVKFLLVQAIKRPQRRPPLPKRTIASEPAVEPPDHTTRAGHASVSICECDILLPQVLLGDCPIYYIKVRF